MQTDGYSSVLGTVPWRYTWLDLALPVPPPPQLRFPDVLAFPIPFTRVRAPEQLPKRLITRKPSTSQAVNIPAESTVESLTPFFSACGVAEAVRLIHKNKQDK